MNIQSMTGFGRGEASNDDFTVTLEVKSVNNRYRDYRFKMSSLFYSIESDFKKEMSTHFQRGSFDVHINYKRSDQKKNFDDLDTDKIKNFLELIKSLAEETGVDVETSPTDFLRSEFYKDVDDEKESILHSLAKQALRGACFRLLEARKNEGEKLVKIIGKHKEDFGTHFSFIESRSEEFKKNVEEKILKRVNDFSRQVKIEESRLLQEVVFYLEKLDVHEEINRINTHLVKLEKLLISNGEIGRQIDFLVQELSRETNTIGSKSNAAEISESVIQMKVQLEKIREQGLNIQ